MNLAQLDDVVVEVGSFAKPSSRKVNHRFTKRTTFSPKRGENNALRNDPGFLSSRHENPKVSATIGRQQAKFRVKKRTVMPLAKIADALAVVETPLQVEETIVLSAGMFHCDIVFALYPFIDNLWIHLQRPTARFFLWTHTLSLHQLTVTL